MAHEGRILLVEDSREWQVEIEKILKDSNYKIKTANTLQKARDLLKDHAYDLVLLDLRLEDWDEENFDGWKLMDILLTCRRENGTHVIIVSAHGMTDHVRDGFKKYKMHDYFDKKKLDPVAFKKSASDAIEKAFIERGDLDEDQYSGA
jgi:DNA-binding response OmpR family regulator